VLSISVKNNRKPLFTFFLPRPYCIFIHELETKYWKSQYDIQTTNNAIVAYGSLCLHALFNFGYLAHFFLMQSTDGYLNAQFKIIKNNTKRARFFFLF